MFILEFIILLLLFMIIFDLFFEEFIEDRGWFIGFVLWVLFMEFVVGLRINFGFVVNDDVIWEFKGLLFIFVLLWIFVIVVLDFVFGLVVLLSMELDGSDIFLFEMFDVVFKLEVDEGNLYRILFGLVCFLLVWIKFLNFMFSLFEGLLVWDFFGLLILLMVVMEFIFVIFVLFFFVLFFDLGFVEDMMMVFFLFLDNLVGVNICCSLLMVGICFLVFFVVIVCCCIRLFGVVLLDILLVKMIWLGELFLIVIVLVFGVVLGFLNILFKMVVGLNDWEFDIGVELKELSCLGRVNVVDLLLFMFLLLKCEMKEDFVVDVGFIFFGMLVFEVIMFVVRLFVNDEVLFLRRVLLFVNVVIKFWVFKELVGLFRENKLFLNLDCFVILVFVFVGSVWMELENLFKFKVDGIVFLDREKLFVFFFVKVVRGGDIIGRGGLVLRKLGSLRGGGSSFGKLGGGGLNFWNKGGCLKLWSLKGVNFCCNEDLINKMKIIKGRLSCVVFRCFMVLGMSSLWKSFGMCWYVVLRCFMIVFIDLCVKGYNDFFK